MGVLDSVAGAGLGLALGPLEDRRQYDQKKKYQKLEIEGAKELGIFNREQAMKMWEDTNYAAQVQQMQKAGLSIGLMYGQGGAGGATTSGAGAGSVSGGQPDVPKTSAADGFSMVQQSQMMEAQKALIEAQTEKTKAETVKTGGVDTSEAETRIASLTQGIVNAKAQEEIQKVELTLKNMEAFEQKATQEDRIDYIDFQTGKALQELNNARNESYISKATMEEKISIIKSTAIGAMLQNAMTSAKIENTKTDTNLKNEQIKNMAQDMALKWQTLEQGEKKIAIEKFKAEMQAAYPSISESGGRLLDETIRGIENILDRAGTIGEQKRAY